MSKLLITGMCWTNSQAAGWAAGHLWSSARELPSCGRVVEVTNDCSMEIALSRRGGPGEFMRTVGGRPAIAAGWEKAYRHNTVR